MMSRNMGKSDFRMFLIVLAAMLAIVFLVLWAGSSKAQSTGSFTLSTTVNGDGTLTPTLSWSVEAEQCVASGDAEWEGLKPASGTVELTPSPTTQPRAFALVCQTAEDSQALLTWLPPTLNTDGTPLTNLAGYRVHYGQDAQKLNQVVQIDNPSLTSYILEGLTPATWFFGIRAYTLQGSESSLSNLVSKTTRAGVEWSQQTGVKVPEAPVMTVQEEEE